MSKEPNYRCEYVACICPKCREQIILKVYAKEPILRVDIAEQKEEG